MSSIVNKLSGIDLNAVGAVETLEKFEKRFDNIDAQIKTMDDVLDNICVGTVNEQEVNDFLAQVAEGQANKIDMLMDGPNKEGNKLIIKL